MATGPVVQLSSKDRVVLENIRCVLNNIFTQGESAPPQPIITPQVIVSEIFDASSFPFVIPDEIYFSYTIVVTTGAVEIDGVVVPSGSYTYSCDQEDTLTGKTITDSMSGQAVVLTQKLQ